jgi:hypothetical protein
MCVSLFISCDSPQSPKNLTIEIGGRNSEMSPDRPIIYQMKLPVNWIHQTTDNQTLSDTTLPIAEFYIRENDDSIRITLHNFPVDQMENRIPPIAQLNRWKGQFVKLDQSSLIIKPQSFAGYQGLYFEALGELKNQQTRVIGWSMQLAPEHFRVLSRLTPKIIEKRHHQMRGDITIKAVGPDDLMKKNKNELITFARSFKLIDEIE